MFQDVVLDGGDAEVCFNLGFRYDEGKGVDQNKSRAVELYGKACDGGEALGCLQLGHMYENGDGVAKNETTAADYLRRGRLFYRIMPPAS